MAFHKTSDIADVKPACITTSAKVLFADTAAETCIIGISPMNFIHNQPGMYNLAIFLATSYQLLRQVELSDVWWSQATRLRTQIIHVSSTFCGIRRKEVCTHPSKLFLSILSHECTENTNSLFNKLDKKLWESYWVVFATFMEEFTFGIDFTSIMPCLSTHPSPQSWCLCQRCGKAVNIINWKH